MSNAAIYFVDRHIEEGREASIAIECGDRRLTYRDLFRAHPVNTFLVKATYFFNP